MSIDDDPIDFPLLTGDLPGIGGVLKTEPEDFEVEEIPAYTPSGEGDHLYLRIEKRNLSADDLLMHLSTTLNVRRDDIGMAGMKDKRAVTRQWVSVPAGCEDLVPSLDVDSVRVLETGRHTNKLRTGHLRGNRFRIRLRDVSDDALRTVSAVAAILRQFGCPNTYGEQRFGRDRDTFRLGLALLTGEKTPSDLPRKRRKFLLRLSLSAVQSALFNRVLSERLRLGWFDRVVEGDVLQKTESGGLFVCESVSDDGPRFESGKVVPTGPLFGPKMREPAGAIAEMEAEALAHYKLQADHFTQFKKLTPGGRRPLAIRVCDLTVEGEGNDIRLAFTLPSGAYATTVLREFQEPTPAEDTNGEN